MKTDPQSGVLLLGPSLPYLDGAEDELLSAMREVGDRSSGSDELRRWIVDWPTRYHLSSSRANLLRPLSIGPGMRVLDAGAGTGALTRYLGEAGAEVFAVEGNLSRARVAQARCEELSNVTVASGPLRAVEDDEGFDLVVLCGVLEYSPSEHGGGQGAQDLLGHARRLLKPNGAVVVAIENQLGLKYLLGYPEDHLGRAFVGLEGYPGTAGVRTWSRRVLAELLTEAGLSSQSWLYPFPDYKLPTVVLSDRLYDEADATDIIDQVLRDPVRDEAHSPVMRADSRRVHRSFLDAGIGRDIANSFLLIATRAEQQPSSLVDSDVLFWRFGDQRRNIWLRSTIATDTGESWLARQERTYPAAGLPEMGFLRQRITSERTYYRGRTLEQKILAAFDRHDHEAVRRVLKAWRDELRPVEYDRPVGEPRHPFLLRDSTRLLPPIYLDVAPDNFVEAEDGVHFIDDEWEMPGGVDVNMALARALWWLAHKLIQSGTDHPWSPSISVDDLAVSLGLWCGELIDRDLLEELRVAEAELQALVSGGSRDESLGELIRVGSLDRAQLGLRGHQTEGAVARLERDLRTANEQIERHEDREERVAQLEAELESCRSLYEELSAHLAQACSDRDETRAAHAAALATLDRIQSRLPMKAYLRTKGLARRVLGQSPG